MRELNLRSVDLNLLTILQILLEEQHVTRAAERLHMSQSAVSRALQRLRVLFNDPLLVKTQEGYTLSYRAEKISAELSFTLQAMGRLIQEPHFDAKNSKATIRVAGVDLEGWISLPDLMTTLAVEAPNVRVEVYSNPDDYYDLLARGRVDLIVSGIVPVMAKDYFKSYKLGNSELVVVMGKNNPLAKEELTLERYLSARHGYVSLTGKGPTLTDIHLESLGLKRQVVLKLSHFLTVADYCEKTDILFMLPAELINSFFKGKEVVTKTLPKELMYKELVKPFAEFYLYWHSRSQHDPLHTWIRNKIIEIKEGNTHIN